MEEETIKINYKPFFITSIICIPVFAFSDLVLLGVWQYSDNYYYLPMLDLFLISALIWFSLKLEFEIPLILILGLAALLFSPVVFILLMALFGNYDPKMLIDFSLRLC